MNKSMSKKFYLLLSSIFIFLIHLLFVFAKVKPANSMTPGARLNTISKAAEPKSHSVNQSNIYDSLKLGTLGLSKQAFEYALKGFNYLIAKGKLVNNNIISIADFSVPSSKKRLFIIDLKNYKILFNTYVAHGQNSGREFANSFSNKNESLQSSPGFYVTKETYVGGKGYSLRLEGEEAGINDNALNRGIVMHAAPYVNESLAKGRGFIGRSWGCPAVAPELSQVIINKIKNGTCLFLYTPNKNYISSSRILKEAA
ncbi:MAG TPA: murein L,D-transpeptidase catalytic domain family protein [Chitinophagaceae bacterium]|nr:murein L,D-transpeptidase catalytic domain family protein [Chitinophagaceae bacterium]